MSRNTIYQPQLTQSFQFYLNGETVGANGKLQKIAKDERSLIGDERYFDNNMLHV